MKKFFLPLLLLISNLCFAQVNLNLGLKAYYPFSGNANDVSGNNNNPVFNNATLTADRLGNPNSAYHFNGTSSYMRIPNNPSLNTTNKLSICAWVRPQGFYTGQCHGNSVIMKGDGDLLPGNYLLRYDDAAFINYTHCSNSIVDVLHQNFNSGGLWQSAPGYTPYIQSNQWYSVIVTYDGTTAKLYMNCELKVTAPQGSATFTNIYDLFIGRLNSTAFPYWVNGDIDEVRIYGRALTVDEVNVLGGCPSLNPCDTWLRTQAVGQTVTVGDLDISGNQVTVEASFNKAAPGPLGGGFLVSKHTAPGDVNYALWPGGCAITTTNGDLLLQENCPVQLNKTYHVALVYDGASLKFYRNGFLHSQAPMSGNLVLNNFITTIGENPPGAGPIYPFSGSINEVRIWNVARTQAQLQAYMNASLPNPPTQTGLKGYYIFDDLLNKQGNATYNGTLNGGAVINATNPNCAFVADSCAINFPPISNIINDYTPVLGFDICNNKLTVEDATRYNVGDTVLMIQMKGAAIDSTNTPAFGTITDYKSSGNYEFNYIKSKTGNVIELKNKLIRQYDIPLGKVQLIRVPYYTSVNISGTLTCLPWDGNKGGVLVLNSRDTVNLSANIDVSGKGFRGGKALNSGIVSFQPFCGTQTYYSPNTATAKQEKGEGIVELSDQKKSGRGPLANGGGGANMINSGGGGGSNGTIAGKGGDQYQDCSNAPNNVGGLGGKPLLYSSVQNKIFLGGGGGAGDANDPNGAASFHPDGGSGGGIIIIRSNYIQSNAFSVIANGDSGKFCPANCTEGMGGGGAGGTILLDINNYISPANSITGKGGKGSDNLNHTGFNHGPGGGGSGAVLFIRNPSLPATITPDLSGGQNGISQNTPNVAWGAQPGNTGQTIFNLQLPFTTVLFKPNIDSVRIKDSLLNCNGFDFKGFAYINTSPIATWQWYFGDGNTANTQNTSHAYGAAGTFNVKLVVTDINGCRDSIAKDVIALPVIVADAGIDTAFCSNTPVPVVLHGSGAGTYSWTPAALLNDPTLQNPTATVSTTTKFYLTVTGAAICNAIDSVTISINPVPFVQTLIDTSICKNAVLMLSTTGLASYNWSTGIYVSDSTIANPFFIDTVSRTLIVTGTNSFGCFAKDTIDIFVKPLPVVTTIDDTTICNSNTVTLVTTGAQTYSWSPALFLNDPNIASPVYSGNIGQTYVVTGTAANGCNSTDTVSVNVNAPMLFQAPPDKTMCNTSSVVLDGYNGTSVDYLWNPGTYLSSTTIINPVASPPATTTYSVLITDRTCNTDSSFIVQVTVGVRPVVNAGKSNDIDCAHKSAILFASGGVTYSWSPSTGLSNSNIINPVATPMGTQQYVVTVTDAGGCSNKDSVTVFSNLTASLARYMPNAFTPNGDGINDCYGLKNWVYIKKLQFYIFNRFGEQVFATASPFKCWDGTHKGKQALAGTYVYYIKAETSCGSEEQKGNFLLIR